jgi:hypothetical protein
MKSAFYAVPRSGGRAPKAVVSRAVELFQSSGRFHTGEAPVATELLNHCLEKKIAFTLTPTGNGGFSLARV